MKAEVTAALETFCRSYATPLNVKSFNADLAKLIKVCVDDALDYILNPEKGQ
jgi:hypothetical protein